MNDSPSDKAIKNSAEDSSYEPLPKKDNVLARDSTLFNDAMRKIEDTFAAVSHDWDLVKIFKFSDSRTDLLANIYHEVKQDYSVAIKSYSIESFRVDVDWSDDDKPQVLIATRA